MKLKKFLLASAIVAAMTGIVATGALAVDLDCTWDAETESVVIANCPDTAAVKTLLVLDTAEDDALLTTVTKDDIKQIDEQAKAYTTVKVGPLEDGVYEVRVGGDGSISSGTFKVSSVNEDLPYDDGTILLGDANRNGEIASNDALVGLNYTIGVTDLDRDVLQALDTNENGEIASNDVLLILNYTIGDSSVLGTKTISEREVFVPVDAE
jgi:hypothetical protein